MAQMIKSLPAMQETWVQSLDQEDSLEKEMATPLYSWSCTTITTIWDSSPPKRSPVPINSYSLSSPGQHSLLSVLPDFSVLHISHTWTHTICSFC